MSQLSRVVVLGLCGLALGMVFDLGGRAGRTAREQKAAAARNVKSQAANRRGGEGEKGSRRTVDANATKPPRDEAADAVAGVQPQNILPTGREAERRILNALQTRLTFDFKASPIGDVIAYLANAAAVDIWVDETALLEEGISLDEPVTDSFQNVSAEQVLSWVLEPLQLAWLIDDGVLQVTAEVVAENHLLTRCYDGSLLLGLRTTFVRRSGGWGKMRATANDETGQQAGRRRPFQTGCAGFSQITMPHATDKHGGDSIRAAEDILQGITAGPWEDIDGAGGKVIVFGRSLVVRQNYKAHREIAGLLAALRNISAVAHKPASVPVRLPHDPDEVDAKIASVLELPIEINRDDVPLAELLQDVAHRREIAIRLNAVALDEKGISADEQVSIHVAGVGLRTALQLVLKPLGCTFFVKAGAVIVTSEDAAVEEMQIVLYNVADLLDETADADALIAAIQDATTGPWNEVDGLGGSVLAVEGRNVSGVLIVRQNPQTHREIAELLVELRAELERPNR